MSGNISNMRKQFCELLAERIENNPDIMLVCADIGYGPTNDLFRRFPNNVFNIGVREYAGLDLCVGLALAGKIPFFYTITPFALARPYETLRLYLNHEKIRVIIVGCGRDDDYSGQDKGNMGFSHYAGDDEKILSSLYHIGARWPETEHDLDYAMNVALSVNNSTYINLKR